MEGRDHLQRDAITHTLMLKPIWMLGEEGAPVLDRIHRFRYLDLVFDTDASPDNVTVGWLPYSAEDTDVVQGSVTVQGSKRVRARLEDIHGRPYHDYAARFKITTTGGTGWRLSGGLLGAQRLPGRKDRVA